MDIPDVRRVDGFFVFRRFISIAMIPITIRMMATTAVTAIMTESLLSALLESTSPTAGVVDVNKESNVVVAFGPVVVGSLVVLGHSSGHSVPRELHDNNTTKVEETNHLATRLMSDVMPLSSCLSGAIRL